MRTRLAQSVALIFLCCCSSTWSNPPGSKQKTVVGAFLGSESRITGDIMKYGFPDTGMVRYREGYVVSYDGRNRVPHWVAERLNAKRLENRQARKGVTFWIDRELDPDVRSNSKDYKESGYVRGRLAAAANHQGDKLSLKQTYLMSNTAPQIGSDFRQAFWVKFEARVRAWAKASKDLYVFTGPLYLPTTGEDGKKYVRYEVIGEHNVAVPTHFFKVLLRERGQSSEMQAFIVPHKPFEGELRLSNYLVSVDEVERLSGLDFFREMSPETQARLESAKAAAAWGESAAKAEGGGEG